ncbi:MAG: hypothetical protein NTZ07_04360 [Candidatus Woesebacteria bacterium]|nr:hypothetical protein [Candidatus Woesebacteria bacterium]
MTNLNHTGSDFVRGIDFALKKTGTTEETIKTSSAASTLAVVYEAARNAVEFRSEHLIRQAAIVRILRRRLFLGQSSEKLAPILIKELIWARYLKDDFVAVSKIDDIEGIINKYRIAFSLTEDKELSEWLLDLAGCEIEENLVFNPYPQLLINFVSGSMQSRIKIAGEAGDRVRDIQVYIATERVFAKNSEIFITYHLLKAMLPGWFGNKSGDAGRLFPILLETKKEIDCDLQYLLAPDIKREITKFIAPFNVIREMVIRNPGGFEKSVADKEAFGVSAKETLEELYKENRGRLMRASTRSIIYIFLTKMIFGLALELPFDIFVGKTNYIALVINLIFPPTLMFLLNAGIRIPDGENTRRILEKVDEYIYEEAVPRVIEVGKRQKAKGVIERIFLFIYSILFVGIFVFIVWGLNLMHFNPVSQAIFLFFLCVVSFFAFRVKSISRDYVYHEERTGFLSSLVDFIFLPVVKVGQWLSVQISRLNVLGFIFDFIIEAPLKAFLEVIEEWVRFVRVKKDEIFTQS